MPGEVTLGCGISTWRLRPLAGFGRPALSDDGDRQRRRDRRDGPPRLSKID